LKKDRLVIDPNHLARLGIAVDNSKLRFEIPSFYQWLGRYGFLQRFDNKAKNQYAGPNKKLVPIYCNLWKKQQTAGREEASGWRVTAKALRMNANDRDRFRVNTRNSLGS